MTASPKYAPGQIVLHQKFGYRGVVVDVDAEFAATDEWYEQVARSRPPKDKPWYHVLVDGGAHATYVAERHLELTTDADPIQHPLLDRFFDELVEGRYLRTRMLN